MRPVVSTKRTAKTRRPERVQALGPRTMGQPLDGSYAALHSVPWALVWDKVRGLVLEQAQEGAWVEVLPGQPFPALPTTARHIALAFDQAARHVAAWEDAGQFSVRQWDIASQQYLYRGPFPGVDPVLVNDATLMFEPSRSDVTVFYLSPERAALRCRVQRDVYAVEYELLSGLSGAVLDQTLGLPYRAELRGEAGGKPLAISVGLYAPSLYSPLSGTLSGPGNGEYRLLVVAQGGQDPLTGAFGGPLGGVYPANDLILNLGAHPLGGAFGGPLGGVYFALIESRTLEPLPVTGAFGGPGAGTYPLLVVAQNVGAHALAGGFSGPLGGTYT